MCRIGRPFEEKWAQQRRSSDENLAASKLGFQAQDGGPSRPPSPVSPSVLSMSLCLSFSRRKALQNLQPIKRVPSCQRFLLAFDRGKWFKIP